MNAARFVIKVLFAFFILFIPVVCLAQSVIGYVTIQNSGGKSACPAQVISYGATATSVNSLNGKFELVYDSKKVGMDVQIEIKKPGYEVVNKNDLITRIPDDSRKAMPVRIYICLSGHWKMSVDSFYGIGSSYVIKNYHQKLKDIEHKMKKSDQINKSYHDSILTLNTEKRLALSQVRRWAEKMASINFDDATERIKKEVYHIKRGDIDSAILLMNENEINDDLIKAKQEIKNADELDSISRQKRINGVIRFRELIEELLSKARLYEQKLDWGNAAIVYEKVIREDSLNVSNIIEVANFFNRQNNINKAQSIYKKGLVASPSEQQRSILLINLGTILNAAHLYREAEKILLEGLNILEKEKVTDSAYYKKRMAGVFTGIADVYKNMGNYSEAKYYYRKSFVVSRNYKNINGGTYCPGTIENLNSLGSLFLLMDSMSKAEITFKYTLSSSRKLYFKDKAEFGGNLAQSLINLATLYRNVYSFDSSYKYFREAIEFARVLSQQNPNKNAKLLCDALIGYGNLMMNLKRALDAKNAYEEAVKIMSTIGTENPGENKVYLGRSLNRLAIAYAAPSVIKNDSITRSKFNDAITLLKDFDYDVPDVKTDLADVLHNYGNYLLIMKSYDEAMPFFSEALVIYNTLFYKYKVDCQSEIITTKAKLQVCLEN